MGLVASCVAEQACCMGLSASCLACSAFGKMLPSRNAGARLGHFTLCVLAIVLSAVLGTSSKFRNTLDTAHTLGHFQNIRLTEDCTTENMDACVYGAIMYRCCAVLVVFNLLIGVSALGMRAFYSGMWAMKLLLLLVGFGYSLFIPNYVIFAMASVARYLALPWLVFQGFLILDLAHDLHEYLVDKSEEHEIKSGGEFLCWWRVLYIFLSMVGLGASVGGAVYFHIAGYSTCGVSQALVISTAVLGAAAVIVSLLKQVGVGLLPPAIMWAYNTLMTSVALAVDVDASCNPGANAFWRESETKQVIIGISLVLLFTASLWCSCNVEKVRGLFDLSDDGGGNGNGNGSPGFNSGGFMELTDGSPYAAGGDGGESINGGGRGGGDDDDDGDSQDGAYVKAFFFGLVALACVYCAMATTGWQAVTGQVGTEASVWLVAVGLWATMLMQWLIIKNVYLETIATLY